LEHLNAEGYEDAAVIGEIREANAAEDRIQLIQ
jgi:hypothetical protein